MGLIRKHSLHHSVPNSQQYIPVQEYSTETVSANGSALAQVRRQLSRYRQKPGLGAG